MKSLLSPALVAPLLLEIFLLPFTTIAKLTFSWPQRFWFYASTTSWHPCNTPKWPLPSSNGGKLCILNSSWFPAKSFCSAKLVFFPVSSPFSTETLLPLEIFHLEESQAFPDSSILQYYLQGDFVKQSFTQTSAVKIAVLLTPLLFFTNHLSDYIELFYFSMNNHSVMPVIMFLHPIYSID